MSKPLPDRLVKILTSFALGLGISSLIAIPAFSQSNSTNSSNRANGVNTSRSSTIRIRNENIRGTVTYPYGSRINPNGIISTPRGERTIPSVSIKRGNGSTSYYYRNGSRINIKRTTIPPTGTVIR